MKLSNEKCKSDSIRRDILALIKLQNNLLIEELEASLIPFISSKTRQSTEWSNDLSGHRALQALYEIPIWKGGGGWVTWSQSRRNCKCSSCFMQNNRAAMRGTSKGLAVTKSSFPIGCCQSSWERQIQRISSRHTSC